MYTNELLKEKYRVQAEISQRNGHDLKKMVKEAADCAKELSKRYNLKLKYFSEEKLENIA